MTVIIKSRIIKVIKNTMSLIRTQIEDFISTLPEQHTLTREKLAKLEDAAALDPTIGEMALYCDVSTTTIHNWFNACPALKERINTLRENPFLVARQTIVKSLDDPDKAFLYMKLKNRKEFAERKETTGVDGGAIETTNDVNINIINNLEDELKKRLLE